AAALALAAALAVPAGVAAQPRALELRVDNDQFAFTPGRDERWYTSGAFLRAAFDAPAGAPDARLLSGWCALSFACERDARTVRVWSLGHRIFTPAFTGTEGPQPFDRPYAAALHAGWAVAAVGERSRRTLELQLGTIGPGALGEPVQNGLHRLIGQERARGWDGQVRSQPLVQLGASRLDAWGGRGGADVVTRGALLLGNPLTQASLGAILRVGRLPEGPTWPGEPALVRETGAWLFAGAELRAVARDALVEGETAGYASRVRREPRAGELVAGASFGLVADWRLELALSLRSVEFSTPVETYPLRPQRIGSVVLRWSPPAR
ncbi:MAG TPA: lipid A deacylase LpxR family protein, partial [Burkholderiaceae bacterium]|nr:lipid A deacylase LpxR family protein [Burkholderiaceae bacterium]